MKRNRFILLSGILAVCLAIGTTGRAQDVDVSYCPGKGERCASVRILFFNVWKAKTKGGPGIIIREIK